MLQTISYVYCLSNKNCENSRLLNLIWSLNIYFKTGKSYFRIFFEQFLSFTALEEVPPPSPASALPPGCAACPDVYKEEASECTTCPAGLFSDGTTCVAKDDCPCVVDDQKYAVGSRFLLKDCSDCICRKGGVSQCQAFACPPCKNPNHQNEQTSKCKCICKPCPQGFRICPTSRVCVREEQWCDGIEHCADDEIDCKKPPKPGM